MKKICFIINTLSRGGGAERTVQNLTTHYLESNYLITIILIDKHDVGYPLDERIDIVSLDFKKDKNFIRVIKELAELLKYQKFDYIFSFLFRSNIINIIASKIYKIKPVVISERSFSEYNYSEKTVINFVIKKFLKVLYSKADSIIAVSEGVKVSLEEKLKVKTDIKVIYNPINLNTIDAIAKSVDAKKNYRLITVGRIIKSKNQKLIIDAVAIVKERGFSVTLSILGEGSEKDELEKYVNQRELNNFILFHGFQDSPEVFLKQSDMFLFASKYEAFGNVILEAMKEGLPVISVKSEGGPKEILENNKYGIVIDEHTPENMAREIIYLIENDKEYTRFSELSLKRVREFSTEIVANRYLHTYDKAKGRNLK